MYSVHVHVPFIGCLVHKITKKIWATMTSIRATNFSNFQNLTGPCGPPTFQAYVEACIPSSITKRYKGVGGVKFYGKKRYVPVTLESPQAQLNLTVSVEISLRKLVHTEIELWLNLRLSLMLSHGLGLALGLAHRHSNAHAQPRHRHSLPLQATPRLSLQLFDLCILRI